ncbi:sororin [Nerophis lumbriciformis]|uniref:sororin n=1 Tax=Nerophis lumbriciformis TaxID=546530 RepID=UPI002AE02626|nr:sororin-B-like [Nerophis lumbriciformis]
MKGRTPPSQKKTTDAGRLNGSFQQRRSPRLTSTLANNNTNMAPGSVAVKRSITVRKIVARKTTAASEQDKENTPRRSPVLAPVCKRPSAAKKQAAMPSPILPPASPPARPRPQEAPEDAVWSQKVRRSYSRLSGKSFNSPNSRETLFGFDKMQTPEVGRSVGRTILGLEVSSSSYSSMMDAEDRDPDLAEPDANIPGVALVKQKRTRRKMKKMDVKELDTLADQMNAEFEKAEEFELVVE